MDKKEISDAKFDSFDESLLRSEDAFMVVDKNGKVIVVNNVVKEMWGVPEETMQSKSMALIMKFFSEKVRDKEWFEKGILEISNSQMMVSRVEIPLLDGKVLDCHSYPMIGADGKFHGRIWTSKDITE